MNVERIRAALERVRLARGATPKLKAAHEAQRAIRAARGIPPGRVATGLLRAGARENPLAVVREVAMAPRRIRRISRGRRGFLRRLWLGVRDVALRPALSVATGGLVS